jgi:hypothetical protein
MTLIASPAIRSMSGFPKRVAHLSKPNDNARPGAPSGHNQGLTLMTYVIQPASESASYRPRKSVDLARFVPDLAAALGGKVFRPEGYLDSDERRNIELDGFVISVSSVWNDPTKVSLHISESERKWLGSNEPYGDDYKMPSIRISVDRPMKTLVADIKRRLLEPAKAPAAKRREYAAKLAASKSNLATVAAALRQRFPRLEVRDPKDQVHSTGLYLNSDAGPYLSGTVYSDGKVSIDRLGQLSPEQFERLMKTLYT